MNWYMIRVSDDALTKSAMPVSLYTRSMPEARLISQQFIAEHDCQHRMEENVYQLRLLDELAVILKLQLPEHLCLKTLDN